MRYILFFILFASVSLQAQKHDNIWHFGGGGGTDTFGVFEVDFSDVQNLQIEKVTEHTAYFKGTNVSMCDSLGNLLFSTNGERIFNKNFQIMDNGGGIVIGGNGTGSRMLQAAVALPLSSSNNMYTVLIVEDSPLGTYGQKLFYNVVDMTKNNGLGKVVEKRKLLVEDSLTWGGLAAVKHANGRDWWTLVFGDNSNEYYSCLTSIDTIKIDSHHIENAFGKAGQYHFTPNGSKYIMVNREKVSQPLRISIFDFDRCTGILSNERYKEVFEPNTTWFGSATSLDSRFLYTCNDKSVYQYDLTVDSIFLSEKVVARWDSAYYVIWPINFMSAQLAPDGRIYVNSSNGSRNIHTIDFPNRKGLDCDFIQRKLFTPTVFLYDMPSHPNYRLGPIDGSPCDTLGLDNHPLAHFRWDVEDTLSPLHLTFSDLSAYEPATWSWDFGDPASGALNISSDTSPVHIFSGTGVYQVCQTVCNANSCDTLCKEVVLGMTNSLEEWQWKEEYQDAFLLYPNPVSDILTLRHRIQASDNQAYMLTLYTLTGRTVFERKMSQNHSTWQFSLEDVSSGLYFYEIKNMENRTVQVGKLLRIE